MATEKDISKALSEEECNLRNISKSIRKIDKLVEKDPYSNLQSIKKEIIKIEKILKQSRLDESIKKIVEQYVQSKKSKIPEWEEQIKKVFGEKLEGAIKQWGFELKGHYPYLKVLFYTLEVNFDNGTVIIWYGPQQEKLDTNKFEPETLAQKLKDIHNRITQREFDNKKFLSGLFDAYKVAIYRYQKKIGDPLPILDVLSEYAFAIQNKSFRTDPIKDNYKDYGRVLFSYDLFKLKERKIENHELNLVTATRAYTQNRSGFLWIPTNEEGSGTYISHIKF